MIFLTIIIIKQIKSTYNLWYRNENEWPFPSKMFGNIAKYNVSPQSAKR